MWHTDPLLGNGYCYATASQIRNSTGAVATQRLSRNNRTVGSGVFYAVRAEVLQAGQSLVIAVQEYSELVVE
jgi:hypothetical protein